MGELGVIMRAAQAEKPAALSDSLEKLFADPDRALLDPEEVWWGAGAGNDPERDLQAG
jgi:hypothetical protein